MSTKNLLRYDFDALFDLVGLERRRSALAMVLPALGLFTLAAGIGAAAGLMLAPSSGRHLRREMGERLDQVRERIKSNSEKKVARGEMNAVAHS
jgi:hypothetical protein